VLPCAACVQQQQYVHKVRHSDSPAVLPLGAAGTSCAAVKIGTTPKFACVMTHPMGSTGHSTRRCCRTYCRPQTCSRQPPAPSRQVTCLARTTQQVLVRHTTVHGECWFCNCVGQGLLLPQSRNTCHAHALTLCHSRPHSCTIKTSSQVAVVADKLHSLLRVSRALHVLLADHSDTHSAGNSALHLLVPSSLQLGGLRADRCCV
jgi:hypothetical protein